jgi:hypothetical protein
MYMYIGNHTKYTRCKPSLFSAHHLTYMPKVCAFLFCWLVSTHYFCSLIPPSKTSTWKPMENPPLQSSSGSANVNTSKPLYYLLVAVTGDWEPVAHCTEVVAAG